MRSFIAGAAAIFCSAVVCFGQTTPGVVLNQDPESKILTTRVNQTMVRYSEIWEATKDDRGFPRKNLSDKERYALFSAAVQKELAWAELRSWIDRQKAKQEKKPANRESAGCVNQ